MSDADRFVELASLLLARHEPLDIACGELIDDEQCRRAWDAFVQALDCSARKMRAASRHTAVSDMYKRYVNSYGARHVDGMAHLSWPPPPSHVREGDKSERRRADREWLRQWNRCLFELFQVSVAVGVVC